jgi:uroporphyrinogen III methyltransferase/synthase
MDLKGKTVLTTRAASQSGELRLKLESLGARVIECPTIEIVPVDDWTLLDAALQQAARYNWLLFTSANAVELFMKRVEVSGVKCNIPVIAIGTATARRAGEWGLQPDIVPKDFRAEGLLAVLPENLYGTHILFPRAETARDVLPRELRRRGARVDVVTVYRTVRPVPGTVSIAEIVASEKIDCIVFTSPSTIRYLAESGGEAVLRLLSHVPVAVIGPVTRDAALEFGLETRIMPDQATIDDLVAAIGRCLSAGEHTN